MILVIDIGNTNTKVAVVKVAPFNVVRVERLNTKEIAAGDGTAILKRVFSTGKESGAIKQPLDATFTKSDKSNKRFSDTILHNQKTNCLNSEATCNNDCNNILGVPINVTGAVISSVVPAVTGAVAASIGELFHVEPLIIAPNIFNRLPVSIPTSAKEEIGSDLLCDALAAHSVTKGGPAIIVDFGTALSFIAIGSTHNIMGVAIAPGVVTALHSLFSSTAQLPEITLDAPTTTLGVDTAMALKAGVIEGYYGLVSHLLNALKRDMEMAGVNGSIKTLATGGVAGALNKIGGLFDLIDTNYTIMGAAIAYKYIKGA